MQVFEVSAPGGYAQIREFPHALDCGDNLQGSVTIPMLSSSVDQNQESEGTHDDLNNLIDGNLMFKDNTINGIVARVVIVKISDTPTNGDEATVRWNWNGRVFEALVRYTGL